MGELDQLRAEAVLAHLDGCDWSHQRYRDASGGVELVLTAAPGFRRPGFSASALQAMGFPRVRQAEPAPRRSWVLITAAAVLGLIGGAAGAGLVHAVREPAQQYEVAGAPLSTSDGEQVGLVAESWFEGERVYVVTVTGGAQTKSYQCQLVLTDGSRVHGGSWELPAAVTAAWIVPRPEGDVLGMELVGGSGGVWASAQV